MVLKVEGRVIDPQLAAGLKGRRGQLLAVARHEMQTPAHMIEEGLEVGGGTLEEQHGPDMHMRGFALLVQEGGIDRGQPV